MLSVELEAGTNTNGVQGDGSRAGEAPRVMPSTAGRGRRVPGRRGSEPQLGGALGTRYVGRDLRAAQSEMPSS